LLLPKTCRAALRFALAGWDWLQTLASRTFSGAAPRSLAHRRRVCHTCYSCYFSVART